MSQRHDKWASGLQALDLGYFALAQELAQEEDSGSWRDYRYSMDHPVEAKQGKAPSTFAGFLEGLAFDMRQRGYTMSRGELEESLGIYRWGTQMGASIQHLAAVGKGLLKTIYRQHRADLQGGAQMLSEALESKQMHEGKVHLPSYQPEGKVTFSVETKDLGDGTYQLLAMNVHKDGQTYKNRWPKALLHFMCKRLRASNITREA